MLGRNRFHTAACLAAILCLALVCGCRKKKYEDPITKKTDQPDKVLFDRAVGDIEHGRYEVARITLNTLINTYDTSEYLAKAKLAIADSWYREGGTHGWAQAEAEYKDFKLFYPTMEEAAESQEKICQIHYKQMEKPDRDRQQAIRAEDECRELLVEYPNSKFAPQAQQMLRNIQEVLASGEYQTGLFYRSKGSFPAAANRLQYAVDQYPLFSQADEALWQLADSYLKMGDRFEDKAAAAYTHIVKDYPLSDRADDAAQKLKDMNRPVPEADPVAYARMKYEKENRQKESVRNRILDPFRHSPDTHNAAKSGSPAMAANRPTIPLSVPASLNAPGAPSSVNGTGAGGEGSNVTVQTLNGATALDTKPDARQNPPAAAGATPGTDAAAPATGAASRDAAAPGDASAKPADPAPATAQALPMNHQPLKKKKTKKQIQAEAQQQQQKQQQQQQPQQPQPAAAQTPTTPTPPTPPQQQQ
jgi:outer membrane protein assembly factor BamD